MKPHDGLTDAEVALRVEMGQTNDLDPSPSRNLWDIIRGNLFTLFNAMLGTAVLIVVLVGSLPDAVFGFVVVINLLIGTFTEYRAKRTLDRLEILNRASVTVKRGGAKRKVNSSGLVIDDVVVISNGEQVPADGRVIESVGLEVDESLLTGESTPIYKQDSDRLLSGSFVIAGEGLYRITQLGADSYAHKITAQAKRFSLVGSELRDAINKILVAISWIIVPVALLLFWSQIHFLPRHLTVVGTFTIGTPAFFLALSPNLQRYRSGFLTRLLRLAVPCGLVAGSGVAVVYAILHNSTQPGQAPSGATLVLMIMALWLLGILARPWTLWRGGLVIVMGVFSALMVAIGPVRDFIALQLPTPLTWALVLSVGAVGAAAIEGAYRVRGRWSGKRFLRWAKSHR